MLEIQKVMKITLSCVTSMLAVFNSLKEKFSTLEPGSEA